MSLQGLPPLTPPLVPSLELFEVSAKLYGKAPGKPVKRLASNRSSVQITSHENYRPGRGAAELSGAGIGRHIRAQANRIDFGSFESVI